MSSSHSSGALPADEFLFLKIRIGGRRREEREEREERGSGGKRICKDEIIIIKKDLAIPEFCFVYNMYITSTISSLSKLCTIPVRTFKIETNQKREKWAEREGRGLGGREINQLKSNAKKLITILGEEQKKKVRGKWGGVAGILPADSSAFLSFSFFCLVFLSNFVSFTSCGSSGTLTTAFGGCFDSFESRLL